MTTPTQETGQPLDFTRPLELVCDGTEVVFSEGPDSDGHYWLRRPRDGLFTVIQHPGRVRTPHLCITTTGAHWENPTGPQIVRNRAEANTPVQADALVEAVNKLRLEMELRFSGQFADNAVNTLDAVATRLAHQPTTDAEAEPVAMLYEHPDHYSEVEIGNVRLTDADKADGWTETPLYAHPPADKARMAELTERLADMCAAMEYWAGCDEGCTNDTASSEIMSSGGSWPACSYDSARAALENRNLEQEEGR